MPLYRHFETQAELDAEYDVGLSVPDFVAYAAWYEGTSTLARQELRCQLNVSYGPTLAEHLDIFSAKQPNAPILIFLHGGYWCSSRSNSSMESGVFYFQPQSEIVIDYQKVAIFGLNNAQIGADLAAALNSDLPYWTNGWTTTMNIYAQVRLVTLVGLVAKNGILIVEFANKLQERGHDKMSAIKEAEPSGEPRFPRTPSSKGTFGSPAQQSKRTSNRTPRQTYYIT